MFDTLGLLTGLLDAYRAGRTAAPTPRRAVFTGIAVSLALHIGPLLLAVLIAAVFHVPVPGLMNFTVSWAVSVVAICVSTPAGAAVGWPLSAFTDLLVCYFCVMFAEKRNAMRYMLLILLVLHAANVGVGMFNWSG